MKIDTQAERRDVATVLLRVFAESSITEASLPTTSEKEARLDRLVHELFESLAERIERGDIELPAELWEGQR